MANTPGLIIVGAGGHGLVVADMLLEAAVPIAGFLDDDPARAGMIVLGLPVLGPIAALAEFPHDAIVVAIGENGLRRAISTRLTQMGESIASAVHPRALLARNVTVGPGAMICARATLTPEAAVGAGAIVNTAAVVEHQTWIGAFAHVGPAAAVGAGVTIGDETLVGMGATVRSGLRIGAGVVIGAGAVVVADLPDDVVAYGVPARVMRRIRRQILSQRSPGDLT